MGAPSNRIRAGLDEALRAARCDHSKAVEQVAYRLGALTPQASRYFCPTCGCHFTGKPVPHG